MGRRVLTDVQKVEQLLSFTYGNLGIDRSNLTRDDVVSALTYAYFIKQGYLLTPEEYEGVVEDFLKRGEDLR